MVSDRIHKVFNEIGAEYRDKLLEADKNEEIITEKLRDTQEKLINVIKVNCKESFDWFQNNATQEKKADGIAFQLDDSKRQEGQKFIEQLQECYTKYDYGLRQELLNSQNEMNIITDDHQSCSNFCVETSENKLDQEIKQCFQNCFTQTFDKTRQAQSRIIGKIDDVYNNLNKF